MYKRQVHTIDGGRRWLDVTPPGSASNGGIAVTVMGSSTAAVVFLAFQYIRNSTFAITSDGGADWTAGVLPNACLLYTSRLLKTATAVTVPSATKITAAATNRYRTRGLPVLPGLEPGSWEASDRIGSELTAHSR